MYRSVLLVPQDTIVGLMDCSRQVAFALPAGIVAEVLSRRLRVLAVRQLETCRSVCRQQTTRSAASVRWDTTVPPARRRQLSAILENIVRQPACRCQLNYARPATIASAVPNLPRRQTVSQETCVRLDRTVRQEWRLPHLVQQELMAHPHSCRVWEHARRAQRASIAADWG